MLTGRPEVGLGYCSINGKMGLRGFTVLKMGAFQGPVRVRLRARECRVRV